MVFNDAKTRVKVQQPYWIVSSGLLTFRQVAELNPDDAVCHKHGHSDFQVLMGLTVNQKLQDHGMKTCCLAC